MTSLIPISIRIRIPNSILFHSKSKFQCIYGWPKLPSWCCLRGLIRPPALQALMTGSIPPPSLNITLKDHHKVHSPKYSTLSQLFSQLCFYQVFVLIVPLSILFQSHIIYFPGMWNSTESKFWPSFRQWPGFLAKWTAQRHGQYCRFRSHVW